MDDDFLPGLDEWLESQRESTVIAPDGKPYTYAASWSRGDIDPAKGEVEIIQFMRPDARRQQVVATIDPERAKKAREHLVVTAEDLGASNSIAIWTRLKTEDDEQEKTFLALNLPPSPVCPKCHKPMARKIAEGILWCEECTEHVEDAGEKDFGGPMDPNTILCEAIDSYEL